MEKIDYQKLRIQHIINKYHDLILRNDSIVGLGRGRKIKQNKWTNIPVLNIFVEKKLSQDKLDKRMIIPKYFQGVVTDIIESGISKERFEKSVSRDKIMSQSIYDLKSGIGILNKENNYIGTLTCGLKGEIKGEKRIFILGSASRLARINYETGTVGNFGDEIMSNKENEKQVVFRIGRISDIAPFFINKDEKNIKITDVDAVLILLDKDINYSPELPQKTKIVGFTNVEIGEIVNCLGYKMGHYKGDVVPGDVISKDGIWKKKLRGVSGKEYTIQYRDVIIVDGEYKPEDGGALGYSYTFSQKDLRSESKGIGILVGGTEQQMVFTSLEKTVEHFKKGRSLQLI